MYFSIEKFHIGKKIYQKHKKTLIIAEAGSNHNRVKSNAFKLIDIAANAGCDAIKFQLFRADKIIQRKHPNWKILKKFELPSNWLADLKKYANKKKLFFGVSPFDCDSVNLLKKHDIDFFKIASIEIQDLTLIKKIASTKKPTIVSTGAADLSDIFLASNLLRKYHNNFAFLHCVSIYPPKISQLNLNMIKSISNAFGVPVGYSDHSTSTSIPSIAVALEACIIEKHITFNKKESGPDHHYALEPKQLKEMVNSIRETEKAMGTKIKQPIILKERNGLFRRIVTKSEILKNSKIKKNQLIVKRADIQGIHSQHMDKIIGKKIKRNITKDEIIKWSDII